MYAVSVSEQALILYRVVTSTIPSDFLVGADELKVEMTSGRSPFPFNYANSAGNIGDSISSMTFSQAILSGFGAEPADYGIRLFASQITAQDFGYDSTSQIPIQATVTPLSNGTAVGPPVTKTLTLVVSVTP